MVRVPSSRSRRASGEVPRGVPSTATLAPGGVVLTSNRAVSLRVVGAASGRTGRAAAGASRSGCDARAGAAEGAGAADAGTGVSVNSLPEAGALDGAGASATFAGRDAGARREFASKYPPTTPIATPTSRTAASALAEKPLATGVAAAGGASPTDRLPRQRTVASGSGEGDEGLDEGTSC